MGQPPVNNGKPFYDDLIKAVGPWYSLETILSFIKPEPTQAVGKNSQTGTRSEPESSGSVELNDITN
jgi:hypothetical protein